MAKRSSNKNVLLTISTIIGVAVFSTILLYLAKDTNVALFNPKGSIADEQQWLLTLSTIIMLVFGLPVILTIYFFTWKYRENNPNSSHDPSVGTSKKLLLFAWLGPIITVIILAGIMLPATQSLEPQRAIASDNEQLTIQVVALDWKWLFIYPEQNIATVNFVQIPVDTPVRFELTADESPMSSFWIPNIGGMLYAMTGHVNPLNLIADEEGDYPGAAAEINGHGFAGMKFNTRVSSHEAFADWVEETEQSPIILDRTEYDKLLIPSENNPEAYYSSPDKDLYKSIVSKYNNGSSGGHGSHGSY